MQPIRPRAAHLARSAIFALAMALVAGCGGSADATAKDGTRADELTGASGSGNDAEGDTEASADESPAATCVSQYPPTLPFDIGGNFAIAVEPTNEFNPPGPHTVETIAAVCMATGGENCDPRRFISMQAALCISEQEAMTMPSERTRRAGLHVSTESERVEWLVEVEVPSPFSPQDPYCKGLIIVEIDAVTGLMRSRYFLDVCS